MQLQGSQVYFYLNKIRYIKHIAQQFRRQIAGAQKLSRASKTYKTDEEATQLEDISSAPAPLGFPLRFGGCGSSSV